ncbi:MAG: DNA-directed RNA polymerase subunit beta [Parcubacteria group bacterium 21-54-25]|nr:MAG: DNA-directed RNA polymerase subunit beta [Parcubacteria group bacterium 21-54-25]HQU07623.1 DNA-directed RNA polymerase subunit beta [Candidatus Paceibacterota bacterium]
MHTKLPQKTFGAYRAPKVAFPDLVAHQRDSFAWLVKNGLGELFKEFSPISDYSGKKFELKFEGFEIGAPKYDEEFARENMRTYEAPIKISVRLINKTLGSEKTQDVFLADMPIMTPHGSFIVSGVERVIVPQLARSFGAFFIAESIKGKNWFGAKIIPARGVWIEIDSEADGAIYVKIDRKRKFPITQLLAIFGAGLREEVLKAFKGDETAIAALQATLAHDTAESLDDTYVEVHRRMRDGDLATPENAKEYVKSLFSSERYDLSRVGRYRLNQRFGLSTESKALAERALSLADLVRITREVARLNVDPTAVPDDIDHLGFRRVRFVGELLQSRMRVGMSRMKRNIQDRMSTIESETSLPMALVNPRPFQASVREFFTANQLSQFMDQQNILAELENLRTLSALGPGGLTRERAGFEVRDVHPSHFGRLCPIHTPEGQNIGLILHLALHARTNEFGVIETPYAQVKKGIVTDNIVYLNALEEADEVIAHSATLLDEKGHIQADVVEVRRGGEPAIVPREEVTLMDSSAYQMFSVAPSLIPFVDHDDANRALMGSNMQKQATPVLIPEAPLVATGIEEHAARNTGRLIVAEESGEVSYVDARTVTITPKEGKPHTYRLQGLTQTNQNSAFAQRPIVRINDKVKKGDVLADATSSDRGQLALGQNVRVAFMSWSGANYEDAIIISERLVEEAKFTTVHIEDFECAVRDTKLGPEVTTHDIPNVGELRLKNLDEEGVVRIGAEVRSGDILVGKVTPKGETQLTPEERLLRSIFGDKAKDVKDSSLRMEGGKRGRIIGVRVFSRENGDQLETGIIKKIVVTVAQVRNVSVGDKLAGRHGNKGVISRVLPAEDMPYDKDGNPVDVILTPLGVPSRMNLGQILEMHLGLAAHALGYQAIVPPFAGASPDEIRNELVAAGFDRSGKMTLFDGRTGEAFAQPIAVGYMYILKLHHMVEDKIHMRSIGPYSLITQQPLGGKAQNGGQRFGEMEVWALLGYGAAYMLREMLTIKSDDIQGRSAAFDAIVKGDPISHTGTPASFSVLTNQIRGLALDVEPVELPPGAEVE